MKFTCLRDNLARGLLTVMHVSGKNVTLPILNNVLIRVKEGVVELTSTNLEIAIVAEIRAKVDVEGTFTVPVKTLADYVQLAGGEQITVELVGGKDLVVITKTTKTKVHGETADEFPIIPPIDQGTSFKFNTAQLREALSRVVFAVSRSEVRPELGGVLFHLNQEQNKGTLLLAATDSYRLSEKRVAVQNEEKEREARVIVPARTVQEIIRVLVGTQDEITGVSIGEGQLAVTVQDTKIVSRLIEGKYPDYRQIIPGTFNAEALLDTTAFAQQMRAASIFSTTGVNAVSVGLAPGEGHMTLRSASAQTGEFEAVLDGELTGNEYTVLLNHRYVLEGLQHIETPKVRMKIVSGDAPCVFYPEGKGDFLYIVMPIKQ